MQRQGFHIVINEANYEEDLPSKYPPPTARVHTSPPIPRSNTMPVQPQSTRATRKALSKALHIAYLKSKITKHNDAEKVGRATLADLKTEIRYSEARTYLLGQQYNELVLRGRDQEAICIKARIHAEGPLYSALLEESRETSKGISKSVAKKALFKVRLIIAQGGLR